MQLKVAGFVLMVVLSQASTTLMASSDDWVLGKWQLVYDPDGSETDYLEFRDNGDVIHTSHLGEFSGIYIVSPGRVKAVLTAKEKDLILTFFHNEEKTRLHIVTSNTGKESIYEKLKK